MHMTPANGYLNGKLNDLARSPKVCWNESHLIRTSLKSHWTADWCFLIGKHRGTQIWIQ